MVSPESGNPGQKDSGDASLKIVHGKHIISYIAYTQGIFAIKLIYSGGRHPKTHLPPEGILISGCP